MCRTPRLALTALEDRRTPAGGLMDTSFGGDGIVKFNLSGYFDIHAQAAAVQPDGKTVLAGGADSSNGQAAAVFRLNDDGSLDTSFGGGDGFVTLPITGQNAVFYGTALQPDGKIVATGSTGFGINFMVLVARFNADGTLDPTFGTNGYVTTDLTPRDENGFSMALQSDGKIVVCGNILSDSDDGFLFLRYTTTGQLDTTFSLDGVVRYNPGATGGLGRGVAIQPDGKIVGVGYGPVPGGPARGIMLVRLNPDGTFDTTFNGTGVVTTLVPGTDSPQGYGVTILPDGRLVAVGNAAVSSMGQPVAARYMPDGSLDTTFDGDGTWLLNMPPDAQGGVLSSVGVDGAGRVVAAGYSAFPHNAMLIRFNENGTPDPSFGVGNFLYRPGVVYTEAGGGEQIYGLTLMSDGRMLTVGQSDNNLVAIRYLGDTSAVADQFTATEDTPLTVDAPGVLANDDIPTGNLEASLVQGPSHALAFTLNADGNFTYTPAANFNGTDSFTYQLVNGTFHSNIVTVTLTVQAVNDPPVAVDDAYQYRFHSPLGESAAFGVLANDSDIDGDVLHAVLVTPPAVGLLDFHDDGSFLFSYPDGLTDPVTFTYKVTDGNAGSNVATVTLTRAPNVPPVATNDLYALDLFGPLTVPATTGVLATDTDADGDPLTATLVSPPPVGTLDFHADGSFTYTFPPDLVGSVTFTYKANDGHEDGNTATVTLTRANKIEINNGSLFVVGSAGADAVRIRPAGGRKVLVTVQTDAGIRSAVMDPGKHPFNGIIVFLGPGDDRIDLDVGKARTTVIGGAGNDVIRTGAGNDGIDAGDGDNVIDAGNGRNSVFATDGNNVIRTGSGPDVVTVGNGRNQISTGAGNDTVTAGTGGSIIDAGAGNDQGTVFGGANWIEGGAGNDVLIGGSGNDILMGGAGKDLLIGGPGADLLDGGLGNDILIDGAAAPNNPGDTLAKILASYNPASHKSLLDITSRLGVAFDDTSADTLTGGAGTDWFWTLDGLDTVLDRMGKEPVNGVV